MRWESGGDAITAIVRPSAASAPSWAILGPLVDTADHGYTRASEIVSDRERDLLGIWGEAPATDDRDPRPRKQLAETLRSTGRIQHRGRVRQLPQRPRIAGVMTAHAVGTLWVSAGIRSPRRSPGGSFTLTARSKPPLEHRAATAGTGAAASAARSPERPRQPKLNVVNTESKPSAQNVRTAWDGTLDPPPRTS